MGQRGSKKGSKRDNARDKLLSSLPPVKDVDIDALEQNAVREYEFDWKRSDALMKDHNTHSLPEDVIHEILSYLLPRELIAVGGTCKSWRRIASDDRCWLPFGTTKKHWLMAKGYPLKRYIPETLTHVTTSALPEKAEQAPYSEKVVRLASASAEGTHGNGTSSLVLRYFGQIYEPHYHIDFMESYRKLLQRGSQQALLEAIDLQQEDDNSSSFSSLMRHKYMAASECVLICSPLRTAAHLKQCDTLYKEVIIACGVDRMPVVLVQTMNDNMSAEMAQVLRQATVQTWVDMHQPCVFHSTSAKTGSGVDDCFDWAVRLTQLAPENRRRYGD